MYLTDFLNEHENWHELLTARPYCLTIKQDGPYHIFSYNMLESDMMLPLVREARGCICRREGSIWICVCRSLDKFGNWSESYAPTPLINWNLGVDVQEKVDGSIMRLWYDRDVWHISTNGTVDARQAACGDTTFYDVFCSLVEQHMPMSDFYGTLDPNYTYWFEMVSKQNIIVVHYDHEGIYYLGRRNMFTMEEDGDYVFPETWVLRPRHYHYSSLNDVLEACHRMGVDEEGYVVCARSQMDNGSFLRVKCKGDEYLARHRLRGNGPLTTARVIEMWQANIIDDFMAYFPEHLAFIDNVVYKLHRLTALMDTAWGSVKGFSDRKDFAMRATLYVKSITSFLFARLDNKVDGAEQYIHNMRPSVLSDLLEKIEL